jgi:hypothetical protein
MNFYMLLWSALSQEARTAAKKTRNEYLQDRLLLQAACYTLLAQRAARTPGPDEEQGKQPLDP